MGYVTYDYYKSIYGEDSMPETDFNRLSWEACDWIDNLTLNKLKFAFPTNEDDIEAVRRCVCKLIEIAGQIEAAIAGIAEVQVANYNCPGQIVISGKKEAVEAGAEKCKEAGAKRAVMLNVSGPFHSDLLKGAGTKLARVLDGIEFRKPEIPYVANVTAGYITEVEDIQPLLVRQVSTSVRWQQSVETMVSDGVDTFIEIGPGRTLAGFNKKIGKAIGKELTTYSVGTLADMETVIEKC